MAGIIKDITDETFQTEVAISDVPVLVDFWAPWCGPCRIVGPMLEEIAPKFQGKFKITKVNVDEHSAVAAKYNVMNIPTMVIFKRGQEVDRLIGAVPQEEIEKRIQKALA